MNLERFKNAGTLVSLASLIGLLLIQFGVNIDLNWLDKTMQIICSIGILLGVFNNPDTGGIDLLKRGVKKGDRMQ